MDSLYDAASFSLDPLFQSNFVYGINKHNFKTFLQSKDLVMVMFYDPDTIGNDNLSSYFAAAAETTNRPNHAYAAVNCDASPELCALHKAFKIPILKLYSGDNIVGTIREVQHLNYSVLKKYVETAELKTSPRSSASPNTKQG